MLRSISNAVPRSAARAPKEQPTPQNRRFRPPCASTANSPRPDLLPTEVTVEETHHDIIRLARFGHIGIVEETMEQAFPHMQVGIDPQTDHLAMGVDSGAEFETARGGDDQRRRKLADHRVRGSP